MFWIEAGAKLPALAEYRDGSYEIIYNIVCRQFTKTEILKSISDIRETRCGFDFHMPKINLFIAIDCFSDKVAVEIAKIDQYIPHVTTNLIISDKDIHKDSVLSIAHKKYSLAVENKIFIAFYFVLFEDYRIIGLALRKIDQLTSMISTHCDYLASSVPIVLELSPLIFENKNRSFYENTHFEIDNIIEELSSHKYFTMDIQDDICGLVNIIRQAALVRGITEKFYTLSTKKISFSFTEYSCFYNQFSGKTLSCSECKEKLLKNLTLKLGVFDKAVKDFLDDSEEKSEFKILNTDWDYIV